MSERERDQVVQNACRAVEPFWRQRHMREDAVRAILEAIGYFELREAAENAMRVLGPIVVDEEEESREGPAVRAVDALCAALTKGTS